MHWILLSLTGAAFAAPVVCGAASPAGPPPGLARTPMELLLRMDTDGDGRVGLFEYQAYLLRGFRQLDRNGDGIVDAAELPAGVTRRGRREPVDLTSREQALARSFQRQDADGDGSLDAVELAAPPR